MSIYVADFETTTYEGKAWVWATGYASISSNMIKIRGNISDFMRDIFSTGKKKVYFHNLKYDGKFIIYYLLKNGYNMIESCENDKEFTALIDKTGTFYSIRVNYMLNGKLTYTTFLDSYKIFAYSLAKCAKEFKLEVTKGEMDYNKVRYENHEMTAEEKDYLIRDIKILQKIMKYAKEQNLTKKITIASTVMKRYKDYLSELNIDFRELFPKLSNEMDSNLRKYYRGGLCVYNDTKINTKIKTYVYDVNSEYPYILCTSYLPYGRPKKFYGKYKQNKSYSRYLQHIKCEFYIKPNFCPMIQLKHTLGFMPNEWVKNSYGEYDLYLTDKELEIFLTTYNVINLQYIDGYMFRVSQDLFISFLMPMYKAKAETDNAVLRFTNKILLNAFYGKFGLRSKKEGVMYDLQDDIIKVKRHTLAYVDTIYLPISIFTTADARCYILSYINKNYKDFIYCDTDSIHLENKATNLPIDNKKLGYFKLEETGVGKYLKQKTYYINLDKEYQYTDDNGKLITNKITCAGLNKKLIGNISIDEFCYGAEFPKIASKNIIGGVALVETVHKITRPITGENKKYDKLLQC